jgi:3-oxoacyl-[acyl-carrier protein] reductase
MLPIDLTGRNALVTGGSRGVGRAAALLLAQAGAHVGISYRSRHEDAQDVLDAIRSLGTEEGSDSLFEACDREFDGLDFFVGNAGIWPPVDVAFGDLTADQWRNTMAVNLDSTFYTTRGAIRRIRPGGSIVLVSSTAGQRGEAFHGDYAASKGAQISLVKGLCVELGGIDVNVNVVAPGWIDTEMSAEAIAAAGDSIARTIPLGRVASAEDVAGPILFLCSPLARHITGEIVNVNGGAVLVG